MTLSEEIKRKIEEEYIEFEHLQYGDLDKNKRKELGAFFTPPVLTIKMLEKLKSLDDDIVDPTMGAGGLLAAAIIAGADPKRIYGIELDETIYNNAVKRLGALGVPSKNLILGDVLKQESWDELEEIRYDNNK